MGLNEMKKNIFKYKHFKSEIIILSVRWYLKYPLSYRNIAEILLERGIKVNPSTIMRWVHEYSPILEKKIRKYLRKSNDSWRVDETSRGIVRKMRIYNVKSIFPADTKGLQVFVSICNSLYFFF
jgi:transposase-like protein